MSELDYEEVSMEEEWVVEEPEVMEATEAAEWKCLYLLVCYYGPDAVLLLLGLLL